MFLIFLSYFKIYAYEAVLNEYLKRLIHAVYMISDFTMFVGTKYWQNMRHILCSSLLCDRMKYL